MEDMQRRIQRGDTQQEKQDAIQVRFQAGARGFLMCLVANGVP